MLLAGRVKTLILLTLTVLLMVLLIQVCLLDPSYRHRMLELTDSNGRELYLRMVSTNQLFRTESDTGLRYSIETTVTYSQESAPEETLTANTTTQDTPHENSMNIESIELRDKPSTREALLSNVSLELSTPPSPKVLVIPKSKFKMISFFRSQKLDRCKLPNCMDNLSSLDKSWFDYCEKKGNKRSDSRPAGDCLFMRGEGRAAVALASLPGSGNTWVRGLLEKATGICTGSLYCDVQLKAAGFNGEEIRSGSVLVVKTHKTSFTWTELTLPKCSEKGVPYYGAVILLLRNPYHALVAERNRKESQKLNKGTGHAHQNYSTHTLTVGPEKFGNNSSWNSFIKTKMQKWKSYIVNLILKSPTTRPKLVVRYEDFQRDKLKEVLRILDFISFPYSHEALIERLENDFGVFHRNRHSEFEAFTDSQEQYMEQQLRQILYRLSTENDGATYRIEEYLRKPLS